MNTLIRVLAGKNYRTEIFVDDEFAYQTSAHPSVEIKNLSILINMLNLKNITISDKEEE